VKSRSEQRLKPGLVGMGPRELARSNSFRGARDSGAVDSATRPICRLFGQVDKFRFGDHPSRTMDWVMSRLNKAGIARAVGANALTHLRLHSFDEERYAQITETGTVFPDVLFFYLANDVPELSRSTEHDPTRRKICIRPDTVGHDACPILSQSGFSCGYENEDSCGLCGVVVESLWHLFSPFSSTADTDRLTWPHR
jgi:hypothetical protein